MSAYNPAHLNALLKQAAEVLHAAASKSPDLNIYFRFRIRDGQATLEHSSVSLPETDEGIGVRRYGGAE